MSHIVFVADGVMSAVTAETKELAYIKLPHNAEVKAFVNRESAFHMLNSSRALLEKKKHALKKYYEYRRSNFLVSANNRVYDFIREFDLFQLSKAIEFATKTGTPLSWRDNTGTTFLHDVSEMNALEAAIAKYWISLDKSQYEAKLALSTMPDISNVSTRLLMEDFMVSNGILIREPN